MTERTAQGPASGPPPAGSGPGGRFWLFTSVGIVAGMFLMAYVAPPLCDLYCPGAKKAGAGQSALALPDVILDRTMKIRFDANVNGLKWKFRPEQIEITTRVGESTEAFYSAENISEIATTGISTFNVTPLEASPFFNLIECFCFAGHDLAPGETVKMPVKFFVDPAIADFPEFDDIKTITVSYTFYRSKISRTGTPENVRDLAMTAPEKPAISLN